MNPFDRRPGIYRFWSAEKGISYVGSSVNVRQRHSEHMKTLRRGVHANGRLQNFWNKYGPDSLCFEVLEYIDEKSLLIEREQHWMDKFDSFKNGFNLTPAAGTNLGRKASEETKAKLRESMKTRTFSPESRAKAAASNTGKKRTPEQCMAISLRRRGQKMTPEQCQRVSLGRKGVKINPELVHKWGKSNIGKPVPPETRRKISESQKGRKFSPEHRANLLAAQQLRRARERDISA